MLKLNHINLSVPDVQQAQQFFETYFDFVPNGTQPNDTLAILSGADDFTLVLMNERMNQKGNHSYPDAFHIGFVMGSEEEVRTVYDKLKAGGVHLEKEPELIRRNLGFYFHHQNFMIEVTCVVKQ
jgi:catechol 2,3-dioxygenase-like lactoylglutathione lyase family enzyme